MTDLTSTFLDLDSNLTAEEIKNLTGWPDRLVEDYLSKFETLLRLAASLDVNNGETSRILNEMDLANAASLRERRVENAIGQMVMLAMRRANDCDNIQQARERVDFNEDPVNFSPRQKQDESLLGATGRLKRLSIDDLTVESIITNSFVSNTNATPANTVAQLELKDKAGTSYYLPLYGSPW